MDLGTLWIPLLAVVAFLIILGILGWNSPGMISIFVVIIILSGLLLICDLAFFLNGTERWSDSKDGLILFTTVFVLSIAIAKILSKRI